MADKPIVLESRDDVAIRSNARKIAVHVVELRSKIKDLEVANGSIVAMALEKANINRPSDDPTDYDLRVNGKPASLLQVLREDDIIYIAPKVSGGA